MTYETIEVSPALNDEQLKSLRFQLLSAAHGRLIQSNTLVLCDGTVKALLLRDALSESHWRPALKALALMTFNPAKNSRRRAVKQSAIGSDLTLGWMDVMRGPGEDILRAGNRDNFFLAMRLIPLLRDMEDAMAEHLPDYWKFHLAQAMRLVRSDKTLLSLDHTKDYFQRKMLERWNMTDYYHFMGTRAFSTLTLNRNIIFGAHMDGNNVAGTLGCLTAIGDYVGGTLCFPRFGVSFDLKPGDLLIADTNEEYHGTSSMIVGERFSIVAYLHSSLLSTASPSVEIHGP
jgi:hypothetical protein